MGFLQGSHDALRVAVVEPKGNKAFFRQLERSESNFGFPAQRLRRFPQPFTFESLRTFG
jgi:hypothetical protein